MSLCRCGGEYGPSEPVTVPLRGLPTVLVTGIEGQKCSGLVAGLLVQKSERLSGAEARFLRKWLGWSGQDTADRLGFTPETVSRWENDKVPISETADKLLRSLVLAREPIEDYAAWDVRLGTKAKVDAEPLVLRMVAEGHTWALAA